MKKIPFGAVVSLFAMFLIPASPAGAQAAAEERPSKVLAHAKIVGPKALGPGGPGDRTATFRTDPALGGIWVAYYYVGALVDESKDGATGFDVGPLNVPKDAEGTFITFHASTMVRPVARPGLEIAYAGVTVRLEEADLVRLMGEKGYREYLESLRHPSNVRHLVEIRRYPLRSSIETEVVASVLRLENMRPLSLEVLVGQGELPKELAAFVAQANGSWIVRHRAKLLIVVTVIALGGALLWRLRQ